MKKQQVKKMIIPAAGWGTRFLPMTKVIPKELLPILNRPSIDYLVDEGLDSGIDEIILVISTRKQEIMRYFEPNIELEKELEFKEKKTLLTNLIKTNRHPIIKIVYQYEQLGLGHAILTGARFFKDEPFAVVLGDDLVKSEQPAIQQLMEFYNISHSSVIGVQEVEDDKTHLYGMIIPKIESEVKNKFFEISGAIEKPAPNKSPSNKAILGRYIFNYSIVKHLEEAVENFDKNNKKEIDLVSVFDKYLKEEKIYAYNFSGTRFDLGSMEGFVKANITYALDNEETKDEIEKYLKEEIFKKYK
ncbi:MAG: UTP--glucose-1-phosphate uridylyltransferase [Metamycoplasmataceae bacterium]